MKMSDQKRPEERAQGGAEAPEGNEDRRQGGATEAFRGPGRRRRTARTTRSPRRSARDYTGEERLLLLDTWRRSELPATEFSELVGVSPQTLAMWRRRFDEEGPAGLMGYRKGQQGSRLPEPVRRAILMMKEAHPDWGQDRIHDMLYRTRELQVSAGAVPRVLIEAGYSVEPAATKRNIEKPRRYERARPNQLWQTDLFTFLLKRQRRRVHLVGFLDDCSRFLVGFGLFGTASGANVREAFESAIANHGAPEEILTDQGTQYHSWRGKSAFRKLCERRGIKQVVARAQHPQTLGKIERFWGTVYRELIEGAVFRDLEDARARIGQFIGYYNFQRTHQGIEGLVPADRFFEASEEVKAELSARVAANAKDLAIHGAPRKELYLTGKMGDRPISLHSEGTKVVLTDPDGGREELDLSAPGKRSASDEGPGESVLDEVVQDLASLAADADDAAPGTADSDAGSADADEEAS